ncbi:hypothetical protein [Mesorhizobium sp. SP-1A]|uniref:bestrophin-like domain n=1 Tax=Mesorhizobium sp. SP-1A TaxID=3077840 RepID=UPI0028F71F99|nr:hypothetical protein [Mesorhizobium sp. SP-1A]
MEILYGLGFLLLFSVSAIGGMVLRAHLREKHLSSENMAAVQLVAGLLVTFAAIILSLQLSTARTAFDAANKDRSLYAAQLARLDECLKNLGPGMEPARLGLRRYTAAVIASTWPDEAAPFVDGMPDVTHMAVSGEDATLKVLMNEIGTMVDAVAPPDAARANVAARCRANYTMVQQSRWAVIEDANGASRSSFSDIVAFWLALVFLSFGLQVPRRFLGAIVLGIGVVAVASVMFVIVDLEIPYGGVFGITSSAMRDALADMMR